MVRKNHDDTPGYPNDITTEDAESAEEGKHRASALSAPSAVHILTTFHVHLLPVVTVVSLWLFLTAWAKPWTLIVGVFRCRDGMEVRASTHPTALKSARVQRNRRRLEHRLNSCALQLRVSPLLIDAHADFFEFGELFGLRGFA